MGTKSSKTADYSGEVNNVIQISADNPVEVQAARVELTLVILTSLVAITLAYQVYKDYRRGISKKI